ncbi:MAG TPA: 2-(1,2-epoxy-1,2-dihydrophenyl)acetyl-CoA isomerase PaaG [Gemmatimonadaceae bacterium]|nr:2-(1,2-epoxy-1,2-dihydrophenyl)acetyl-CoA isomerase PaaG [Gemmatimonadaceae bacterium]
MPTIATESADGVVTITLNRPEVLNAFNGEMAAALQQALASAAMDVSVRAVLLTGAGRGFSSGQDLAGIPNETIGEFDIGGIVASQYNPIIRAIREMEKPVVCAVNGVAAGAGANLAFACDIVLAAREANFIQSFCKIGLIPDSSGTYFLPRLAGLARATGMALLGDKISAEQARDWGLIWQVVDGTELMATARDLARRLATQPTRAFGLTKRALNASLGNDLTSQLALEEALQREAGFSHDFGEGVRAFLAKRPPTFQGR